jgi:hypothetical protein
MESGSLTNVYKTDLTDPLLLFSNRIQNNRTTGTYSFHLYKQYLIDTGVIIARSAPYKTMVYRKIIIANSLLQSVGLNSIQMSTEHSI